MKKIISLTLALIMAFSLTIAAFAADTASFVLLGDSIAYGHGLKDKANYSYGALISSANGYSYTNHAHNGDTTYDLNDKLTRPDVIASLDSADIIAVSIGGNNFLTGGIALMAITGLFGNYDLINDTADDFYENFSLAIDTIKSINPEATLLVQTLYNPRNDFLKGVYQHGLDRLNAYIRQAAPEKDFTVIEVAEAFSGHAGEYIQDDVIHPNERGDYVIACEYLKVLKAMGLGTAEKPLVEEAEVAIYSVWDKIMDFFKKLFR
ncbi:MAG: hypothetical protein IJW86_10280 [Clostridia bacterium]|nr:hypothetical protein [Clostridia bacterium]